MWMVMMMINDDNRAVYVVNIDIIYYFMISIPISF